MIWLLNPPPYHKQYIIVSGISPPTVVHHTKNYAKTVCKNHHPLKTSELNKTITNFPYNFSLILPIWPWDLLEHQPPHMLSYLWNTTLIYKASLSCIPPKPFPQ